jgi:hypothetical protein
MDEQQLMSELGRAVGVVLFFAVAIMLGVKLFKSLRGG